MDYQKIYNAIIQKARSENRIKSKDTYYEAHHIIPKCLGGTGKCTQWRTHPNIVLLTGREHFLCHWLLCEIYKDNNSIISAFLMMCNNPITKTKRVRYITSSRIYEIAKINKSNAKISEKTRQKMRDSKIGNKNGSGNKNKKRLPCTEETKLKIGLANKNRIHSEQSRKNMSLAHIGKSQKSRKIVECPHCHKSGGINGMTRYHFDNCKNLEN